MTFANGAPSITIFQRQSSMDGAGAIGRSLSFVLLAMEGCFAVSLVNAFAKILLLVTIFCVFIAAFAWKGEYGPTVRPRMNRTHATDEMLIRIKAETQVPQLSGIEIGKLSVFQDVHVMIFVGFGFLMTFLQRYGFGAVGFNFLIASYVVQWAIIVRELATTRLQTIALNMHSLITADFIAGAVLISFGAVLGKTTPLQLIAMSTIEVILYCVNEYIGVTVFGAVDVGGSIFIHTFGAYFGLAAARMLHRQATTDNPKEGSVYTSDLFSMIGTVFLWMYWPSFNAVTAAQGLDHEQHRAVVNTYLSIAASCIAAFGLSPLLNGGRLNMVHIQNATLAGGVAVGAVADNVIEPWGACVIGAIAGLLSTVGYQHVTPLLNEKLKLHDTCGVNNLHGMPGVMAGIASIVTAMTATPAKYGQSLCTIYAARCADIDNGVSAITAVRQGSMQAAALGVTLVLALAGGAGTGLLMKFLGEPKREELFDDTDFWDVPDGFPEVLGEIAAEYQATVLPQQRRQSSKQGEVTEQRF